MAGSMLALYSIKLIYEYMTESDDESPDTKEDAGEQPLGYLFVRGSFTVQIFVRDERSWDAHMQV